jgi:MFS family permease
MSGFTLIMLFLLAHTLAAGVILMLGHTLNPPDSPWPWILICAIAVGLSLGFLRLAIPAVFRLQSNLRRGDRP